MFSKYACSTSVASTPSTANAPPFSRSRSGPKTKLESGRGQQQPLDRALLEEGAVRAVSDDGETLAHGEAIRRARSFYLPSDRVGRRRAGAAHAGHHGLVIASNRLPIRLTIDGSSVQVQRSSGGLSAALSAFRGDATLGRLAGHRGARSAREAREQAGWPRITCTRSSSPRRTRRTSTGRSATTRSGRSSTTSRDGCGSRPRPGRGTSR